MLHENMKDGEYFLETRKYNVAIQEIESSRKVEVTKKNGNLKVNFTLKIDGVIREYTGKSGLKQKKQIKKTFTKNINSKSVELVKEFQQQEVDPLGIEEIVKSRFRDYSSKKFEDAYPTMAIDVDTKFTPSEFGTRR